MTISEQHITNRRQFLQGAIALGALGSLTPQAAQALTAQDDGLLMESLPANWWALEFDRPQGGRLKLADFRGKPLLVNFWASWCPPCIKEMPDLVRFQRNWSKKGGQVLGLAIDSPTPARQFLSKNPVNFDVGLAGMGCSELMSSLGNLSGGLPFSVMISPQGHLIRRKMGATHLEELQSWAQTMPR